MSLFAKKTEAPDGDKAVAEAMKRLDEATAKRVEAQKVVDALRAKISGDEEALAAMNATISEVSIAIELSDVGGPGRDQVAIDTAMAQRMEITQRIERRQLAVASATEIVSVRDGEIARLTEDMTWARQVARLPKLEAARKAAIAASEAANRAWLDFVALGEAHVQGCPIAAIGERFSGQAGSVTGAYLARASHMHQLAVSFDPKYRPDSLGGTLADVDAQDQAVCEKLAVRVLPITAPPAPPPDVLPEGMTRGQMRPIARVA